MSVRTGRSLRTGSDDDRAARWERVQDHQFQDLLEAATPVFLEVKRVLLAPGERIDTIYFPQSAVVSLLTTMGDGSSIEIATVGNEGIVGVPVFLTAESMAARDFYNVQVPGRAVAVSSRSFLEATGRDPMRGLVMRYTQALSARSPSRWRAMCCIPS